MSAVILPEQPVWEVVEPALPKGGFAVCAGHVVILRVGRLHVHRLLDGELVAELPTSAHALTSTPHGVLVREYSSDAGTHLQLLKVPQLDVAWACQLSGAIGDRVTFDTDRSLWLRHLPLSPTRSELVRISGVGVATPVEVPNGLDDFGIEGGRIWVTRSPGRKSAAGLRRRDRDWTVLIQAPCTLAHADDIGLLVRQPSGRSRGTLSHWAGCADTPTWTVAYDGAIAARGDLVLVANGFSVRALRRADASEHWSCTLAEGRSVRTVRWLDTHALLTVRHGPDVFVDLSSGATGAAPTSPSDSVVAKGHLVVVGSGRLRVWSMSAWRKLSAGR